MDSAARVDGMEGGSYNFMSGQSLLRSENTLYYEPEEYRRPVIRIVQSRNYQSLVADRTLPASLE